MTTSECTQTLQALIVVRDEAMKVRDMDRWNEVCDKIDVMVDEAERADSLATVAKW